MAQHTCDDYEAIVSGKVVTLGKYSTEVQTAEVAEVEDPTGAEVDLGKHAAGE